jgi:hypothetical protein
MRRAGFEPTIPSALALALDRGVTVVGMTLLILYFSFLEG